jgi:hypothetical protein
MAGTDMPCTRIVRLNVFSCVARDGLGVGQRGCNINVGPLGTDSILIVADGAISRADLEAPSRFGSYRHNARGPLAATCASDFEHT